MESKRKSKTAWGMLTVCAVYMGTAGGCISSPEAKSESASIQSTRQALTASQTRVLGFETPTADWSTTNGGSTLSQTSTASQGAAALSVMPSGWTEINSIQLSSLGTAKSAATVDVRLPATVSWGEVRLILIMPSQNIWWKEVGSQALSGLSANTYHTLSFPLDASTVSLLSGTYNDLVIKVVVNAPRLSAPYLMDNLVMTDGGTLPDTDSEADTDTDGEQASFHFRLPSDVRVEEAAIVASDSIRIADGVSASSMPSYVYCDGTGLMEIGADAWCRQTFIQQEISFCAPMRTSMEKYLLKEPWRRKTVWWWTTAFRRTVIS